MVRDASGAIWNPGVPISKAGPGCRGRINASRGAILVMQFEKNICFFRKKHRFFFA